MATQAYHCLFSRNYDKKKRTWRDGVLMAQETLRFVRVMLYEVIDDSTVGGSPLDVFDLFNHKYDKLTGETISSSRFIVNVGGIKRTSRASALPQLKNVERLPALLPGKSHRRTPTLGIRSAFKKYRISEGDMGNVLPNVTSAIEERSSNDTASVDASVNALPSDTQHRRSSGGSNSLRSHNNKSKPDHANYSAVRNSPTQPSPGVLPSPTSISLSQQQPTKQVIATSNTESGYNKSRNEGSYPKAAHVSHPSTVCQVEEPPVHQQQDNHTVEQEIYSLSHGNVGQKESPADKVDGFLYEDIVEDLVMPGGTNSTQSNDCDIATIVDSELIDCIESALDHIGDFADDF